MKLLRKTEAGLLCLVLLLTLTGRAFAVSNVELSEMAEKTAQYLETQVTQPQSGSVGGEWLIIGLARGAFQVPEGYFQRYFAQLEDTLQAQNGVLSTQKYTETARAVLAVTALGQDARSVAGYDLTAPLGEWEQVVAQGLNGPVWTLLALDSGNYPMPQGSTTRQDYVDEILSRQLECGGWNLNDRGGVGEPDTDVTAMVLQALANYRSQSAVQVAVDKALTCLSKLQNADGSFSANGEACSESIAQVMVALTAMDISLDDSRFVKNGTTPLDALLTYQRADGSFSHTKGSGANQMATEQALYALVAVQRAWAGKNPLYQMSDAAQVLTTQENQTGVGLPNKHPDVQEKSITQPGKTFSDLTGHPNQAAIEALAIRGMVDGKGDNRFEPDAGLTRAEFATLMTAALGLTPQNTEQFQDVNDGAWYAGYVGAAYAYGIVSGTGANLFAPDGTITRQEAAVMTAAAARLCGLDTEMRDEVVRDTLAPFADYTQSAAWARPALAFCYTAGILDDADLDIRPTAPIQRGEMAQMLYQLLDAAQLLGR